MASVERIEQELNEAKVELDEAKVALQAFKEDVSEGLLLKQLRRNRKGLDEEDKQEKARLEEREKQLEAEVAKWGEDVRRCREALLPTTAQPGNDFVTRALGT